MSALTREDLSINSILGPGTTVNGDVIAAGFVRVDGSLKGNLTSKGRVVVGERARIRGDITGTTITIGGVVQGNVIASERITILSGAILLGDVVTRRIQADDDCLIHGKIISCSEDADWSSTLSAYQDERSVSAALRDDTTDRSDG